VAHQQTALGEFVEAIPHGAACRIGENYYLTARDVPTFAGEF
jgi:hypothetical protein